MDQRVQRVSPSRIAVGEFDLDREGRRVRRGGRAIRIGATEFRLLEALMEQPGRVLSRADLVDAVWGRTGGVDPRTVDAHISRLRRALVRGRERDPIETARGYGYSFAAEAN